MKPNPKPYMDAAIAQITELKTADTVEALEAYTERIIREAGDMQAMWQELLDGGWTVAELDDIYYRRTGFRMVR